ncbi:MAG TPA: pyridoxal-phosphate dependent enzyme [Chitinophagaceae bacterium]
MQNISPGSISIEPITLNFAASEEIGIAVLRLDKIHPVISGNKWFKLQFYLKDAIEQGKKTILTFGGAWSNHIIATAAACQLNGLSSIGIIRGEEAPELSPTLKQAKELGTQLYFTSREEYVQKKIPGEIDARHCYIINEGGFGELGAKGAATIAHDFIKEEYTHICCAVGTGTMIAGLINATSPSQQVFGISVMKNNLSLEDAVRSLLTDKTRSFELFHEYHFGGYAKHKPGLLDFMNEFYRQTAIPSDFVYTGKLFYAIKDLIKKNSFPAGSKLLLIHSGGLQGNASVSNRTLIF